MISIEFFHIYTDENIDQEKIDSLEQFRVLTKALEVPYYSTILIDDYTPKNNNRIEIINDIQTVNKYMLEEGIKVSNISYESALVGITETILQNIHYQDCKNYKKMIDKNGYLPCSLFVLSWYLLRLGAIKSESIKLPFEADNLINILPLRYKAVDDIVLKVLARSKFKELIKNIKGIYFESGNNFQPTI